MSEVVAKRMPEFIVTRNDVLGFDRIDIDFPDVRVGNVRCRFMGDTVVVFSIQVFPEFQDKGYGRAAIDMLKTRFRVLLADRVRFAARGFWEKMEFREMPDGNWEYRRRI